MKIKDLYKAFCALRKAKSVIVITDDFIVTPIGKEVYPNNKMYKLYEYIMLFKIN